MWHVSCTLTGCAWLLGAYAILSPFDVIFGFNLLVYKFYPKNCQQQPKTTEKCATTDWTDYCCNRCSDFQQHNFRWRSGKRERERRTPKKSHQPVKLCTNNMKNRSSQMFLCAVLNSILIAQYAFCM